jgi:hypothetical protein
MVTTRLTCHDTPDGFYLEAEGQPVKLCRILPFFPGLALLWLWLNDLDGWCVVVLPGEG